VGPKVSVGPSTAAGLTTTLVAFALAIVAFAEGDRTEETIMALVVGLGALAGVVWSRTRQVIELTRRQPVELAPARTWTNSVPARAPGGAEYDEHGRVIRPADETTG